MSGKTNAFSEGLRQELAGVQRAAQCCRRAYLYGMMINADTGLGNMIYARLSGENVAQTVCRLVGEQYGRECVPEWSNCYGRRTAELNFVSEKLALVLSGLSDPAAADEAPGFLKCGGCAGAFCAGLLLSCAAVSDPGRSTRVELRINDPIRATRVRRFFEAQGLYPSLSVRSGVPSLMFKRADDAEALVTLGGAVNSAMEMMQRKLLRELRGDVNRRSNCEVRNLDRAVGAAAVQAEAVELLRDTGAFELLSEELKETACLREIHPEASLTELALLHEPPITKSGLNHRMEKILRAAEEEKKKMTDAD